LTIVSILEADKAFQIANNTPAKYQNLRLKALTPFA
jgi:hypothetical protein